MRAVGLESTSLFEQRRDNLVISALASALALRLRFASSSNEVIISHRFQYQHTISPSAQTLLTGRNSHSGASALKEEEEEEDTGSLRIRLLL
eukprot:scaffold8414_cov103-Skeletonema_marinoi.AAC.1